MKTLCTPFKVFFVMSLVILGIEAPILCLANSIVINPSDDGYCSIYDGQVHTSTYLTTGGDIRGLVEFPISAVYGQIEKATLSVNPRALPLWSPVVSVYGYPSNDGRLTSSDCGEGAFLGYLLLPSDLRTGEDAYFDVTTFLKTVTTPYVGFNLRTANTDVFSSLESNYGHPSQLSVVFIPEPATLLLLALGAVILKKRKK
jgi:hypothetical protein